MCGDMSVSKAHQKTQACELIEHTRSKHDTTPHLDRREGALTPTRHQTIW
jgi:hypothetical protein